VLATRSEVFENMVLRRIFRTKMGLYEPDWPQGAPSLLDSEYWVFFRGKVARAWCSPPTHL
jgi:hypothetical protein